MVIHYRAIAEGRTKAQIALDERRQRLHRCLEIKRLAGHTIHPHMQARQRLDAGITVARGVMLEERERHGHSLGLMPSKLAQPNITSMR